MVFVDRWSLTPVELYVVYICIFVTQCWTLRTVINNISLVTAAVPVQFPASAWGGVVVAHLRW